MWERALALLDGVRSPRILDLCCGSGAIGIALLANIPGATGVFADVSAGALRVCRKNIENQGLAARTQVLALDALEPAPPEIRRFDLIACNPPYISADGCSRFPWTWRDLNRTTRSTAGMTGWIFTARSRRAFYDALRPGGIVLFECGAYQGFEVSEILKKPATKRLQGI